MKFGKDLKEKLDHLTIFNKIKLEYDTQGIR